MLKKVRVILALLMWVGITMLLLDVSGLLQTYLGWMAKIQFLPAVLAANVGAVVLVVVLTILLGRIYCSVICPLGIFQDAISWVVGKFMTKPKQQKMRFSYFGNKGLHYIRYAVLFVTVIMMLLGVGVAVRMVAPYSIYGRMVVTLLKPLYVDANNLLADAAVSGNTFTFWHVAPFQPSTIMVVVAIAYLAIVGALAMAWGRAYCSQICPVGTFLGLLSRRSIMRVQIDADKCKHCGLCEMNCKAHAIDAKNGVVDASKCIDCFNCLDKCHHDALSFGLAKKETASCKPSDCSSCPSAKSSGCADPSRRSFLFTAATMTAAAALKAEEKTADGGYAIIVDKKPFKRETRITPPGAISLNNLQKKCTGCQLCISACPNQVLRPSTDLLNFMQPEMSYENGFCRPECHACSDVCPAGAIIPLGNSHEEKMARKSSTKIGRAVWIKENCLPVADGVRCGTCARRCPSAAISMVPLNPDDPKSLMVPAVNDERCIGCGACEQYCPVRPFSAIHVEGIEVQREI